MKHFYNFFSIPKEINSQFRSLAMGLVVLVAANSAVNAQVNIGSGTTTGVVPVVMSTAYTYSQQIFNATEINANGSITGIKLYLGAGSTIANSDDWVVYMGTTDKNSFDSTTDWIPVSSLTQVFSGVVVNNNGEVTITLPTPFVYNGNQNLVVAVDENKAGTNTATNRFYTTSTTSTYANRSLYRSATTDVNPDTPGTGTRSSIYSNITFLGINQTCGLPTNITTASSTTDSAVLNWSAPASGSPTYEYYYSTSDVPPSNTAAALGSVSTTNLSINSALTAGTYYYFWLRSVCGSQKSAWTYVHTFVTACVPVNSMYENFDSYATGSSALFPACWMRLDAQGTVNVSATTPNSGTGNMYQYAASGNSNIVILPIFNNINANTHWLRFKARVTTAPRDVIVGYITNFSDASTFVPLQTLSIVNTTYSDPVSEYTVEVPATVPATARLAIKNPGNSATTLYYDDVYWEAKPSCLPPSSLTTTTLTSSSGSVSWSASPSTPSNGYEYYYSTSSTDPIASTVPSGTVTAGVTTAAINGLASNTTYYVWVRSVCSTFDKSSWIAAPSFKTLCGSFTSIFENFDSYTTGNIVPDCWERIITTNGTQTISTTTPASGTRNIYQYSTSTQNPSVVVLPQFSNVNAGTHWLRFKARVSTATGTLNVGYVTDITNAGTFNVIQALSISNTLYDATSEYKVVVPSSVPANARLAIMNTADGKSYYWDDVYWEMIPTCFAPVTTSISAITPITAQVSWIASTTPPANGYDVYYSTSSTPPTSSTVPSVIGVSGLATTISSLAPSTMYYVWVRSRCSTTDISDWSPQSVSFTTLCQPPVITSTNGTTVCPNNSATLTAVSSGSLTWYDAATGGNNVGTGTSFTTPVLNNTTNYWVSASTPSTASVGPLNATIGAGGYSTLETYRTFFTANTNLTIESVDVFPNTVGQTGSIEVYTAAGTLVQSVSYTTTSGGSTSVPQVVPLNISVPAGNYYMKMGSTSTSLYRNTAGATFPYSSTLISLTGQSFSGYPEYFYFFYNWKVVSACESPRTMVTATVDTNCLTTSEIDKRDAIKVYPNPFSEIINITKPELVKTVRVSDISGKLLRTINQPEAVLRLNDLPAGMYLLQLDMKNGSQQSIKIVKK